jgi:CRISPR system Cascade subunit CasC
MKVELHMIQNFPPHCLNRDDTNSPKDCLFGGARRARISSQCIKRSIRKAFAEDRLLPEENLGHRTKRLAAEVADRLAEKGKDRDIAHRLAQIVIGGLGFGLDDEGNTQYLVFMGESGVRALAELCEQRWDQLAEVAEKLAQTDPDETNKKTAKQIKKAAKEAVPDDVKDSLADILDGSRAADLALFGRMLADRPAENIDAACQVAHAISTHKVQMEMDFYTAVDDLKPAEEDAGAGMMGVIGYNSACFYRYAVVDVDNLIANLGGDSELAARSLRAFLRGSATAIPTGKQNTFAAHNPPDFIQTVVRSDGAPLSLANAFANPVSAGRDDGLVQKSVDQLVSYADRLHSVYGNGSAATLFCATEAPSQTPDSWKNVGRLDDLIDHTVTAAFEGGSS